MASRLAWLGGGDAASSSPLSVADCALLSSRPKRASAEPSPWFPGLLSACLAFLDLVSLLQSESVSTEWHAAANDPALWTQLYCVKWRRGAALPSALVAFSANDMKRLCRERSCLPLGVSTRAMAWVHNDETLRIHNVSLQRKFSQGCVESIRTDHALHALGVSKRASHAGVLYYEVAIRGCGSVGVILLAAPNVGHFYGAGSSAHVGWLPGSYGYHGDDGKIYWHDGTAPIGGFATRYGPSWGDTRLARTAIPGEDLKMATIGCGVDLARGRLFFTSNGAFLGHAHMPLEPNAEYGAAVSLHHLGDMAELNLGRAPFLFDIEAYVANVALQEDSAQAA